MNNDLATKKDLEALKNELLDKMVTKEDHKKEIAKLVTKKEFKKEIEKINKRIDNLASIMGKYSVDIMELKDEVADIHPKIDHIFQSLDGFMRLITNGQVEKAAAEGTFQRHEYTLDKHEQRITRLEEINA